MNKTIYCLLPAQPLKSEAMKKQFLSTIFVFGLLSAGVAIAQRPAVDILPARHPNLAAAQELIAQAWDKVSAAELANEGDMRGHGKKAKELLDAANREIKLAAEAANRR